VIDVGDDREVADVSLVGHCLKGIRGACRSRLRGEPSGRRLVRLGEARERLGEKAQLVQRASARHAHHGHSLRAPEPLE
jgi:hypothetical protein